MRKSKEIPTTNSFTSVENKGERIKFSPTSKKYNKKISSIGKIDLILKIKILKKLLNISFLLTLEKTRS